MSPPASPRLLLLAVTAAVGLAAPPARAADPATLPLLTSRAGDAFTAEESDAIARWTLAQPEVRSALGEHRTRLLRVGSDQPKGRSGPYRRASLFVRDYDTGLTHQISVHLATAEIEVRDYRGLAQPSEEEIQEARSILRSDPEIESLFDDPQLEVTGGFFTRSPHVDDPCFRDVCVQIEVARRRPGQGFARRMIVNLSRREIAHRAFRTPDDPSRPTRMTETGSARGTGPDRRAEP